MRSLEKRLTKSLQILTEVTPVLMEGFRLTPGHDSLRSEHLELERKSSFKDLVTKYDKKTEEWILEKLQKFFPGEMVLGEESLAISKKNPKELAQNQDCFWLLDPIDGTTNYSRSYPFFCSTLAWVEQKNHGFQVQVAATWNPVAKEMFYATHGGGAFLNREGLKVSSVSQLEEALLTTGFASERNGHSEISFELFKDFTRKTLGVRRDGAAALDLAFVAAGRIDVYFEWGLSAWDIAAGVLLVREAGGKVTNLQGAEVDLFSGQILSSNPHLHSYFCQELSQRLSKAN